MRCALLVLLLALACTAIDAASIVRSGKVAGVVVDARDGKPLAGAVVIVRWSAYFPHLPNDVCVKSVAATADATGHFELAEWRQEGVEGDTAYFIATSYAPGYLSYRAWPSDTTVAVQNVIRLAPASDVRIEMSKWDGDYSDRLDALQRLVKGSACVNHDEARDFYRAIRSEVAAMPLPARDRRTSPSQPTSLELLDAMLQSSPKAAGSP